MVLVESSAHPTFPEGAFPCTGNPPQRKKNWKALSSLSETIRQKKFRVEKNVHSTKYQPTCVKKNVYKTIKKNIHLLVYKHIHLAAFSAFFQAGPTLFLLVKFSSEDIAVFFIARQVPSGLATPARLSALKHFS